MFTLPTKQDMKQLWEYSPDHCVSIYCPYIVPNARTNPTRIQFKDLLKQAKSDLAGLGLNEKAIKKTVLPAEQLLRSPEAWPPTKLSVVAYMHEHFFKVFYLPAADFEKSLFVGSGFELSDMQDFLENTRDYYLLSLNQNKTQLYKGGRFGITPLRLKNFPSSLAKALKIDEYPNAASSHAVGQPNRDKQSAAFHGHYNAKEVTKKQYKEFFRQIDQYIGSYLKSKKQPLILGGVDYLLPIYRQINSYPNLLEEAITGNLERVTKEELLQRAWSILDVGPKEVTS